MKIEELMEHLYKEYGDKVLGSTTTKNLMLFAFEINGKVENIYIPISETNEEAMRRIKILLDITNDREEKD